MIVTDIKDVTVGNYIIEYFNGSLKDIFKIITLDEDKDGRCVKYLTNNIYFYIRYINYTKW